MTAAAAAAASSSSPSSSLTKTDAPPSYLLPYATLQPTYHQVYADILESKVAAENVWLSVYADNAPQKSIHATLTLAAKEKNDPSAQDEVQLENIRGQRNLLIKEEKARALSGREGHAVPDLSISTSSSSMVATSPTVAQNSPSLPTSVRLRLPVHTPATLLKGRRSQRAIESGGGGQISAFDVSPDGTKLVAGGEDGECVVAGLPGWIRGEAGEDGENTHSVGIELAVEEKAQRRIRALEKKRLASLRLPLTGHVGDVQAASFLPSSLVLLTASSDLTLRLYSAQDGICPRVFKGHKRAVTSTAILGRGKRIVSASLDGTIRVWDVRAGKSVRMIGCRGWSGVECLRVLKLNGAATSSEAQEEEGLGDYLAIAGLSSGYVQVFLLRITQDTTTQTPAQNSQEEDDEASVKPVTVTDWPLLEIAPRSWPTLPEGQSQPGASDFWKVEPSTGAVWSLDIVERSSPPSSSSAVAAPESGDAAHSARSSLDLVTGSKTGIVRLFRLELGSRATASDISNGDAQEGEEDSGAPLSLASREVLNFRRNTASIHALRFLTSEGRASSPPDAVVATGDGTPFRLTFKSTSSGTVSHGEQEERLEPSVKEEYTGWEAGEPVHGIGVINAGMEGERILLAGAEGMVRVY
ncbi:hypothetical protein BCV69DRAFT_314886 [Microstroma glucosiphilum]|uniref:Uncharacterized protein n=1 Tax=Pseudomicrostroma glucosiphilum TaxID=1684307 RepID=A0A316TXG5_9BASI|nr:hypothetical protein BCV69DRAFT_314886 [Pseudomicrostroma glucosiphilum]PWN18042.1 hypothetical protein BCV69DRAFT_314886 [Pseudomicrostroma glucosiphilum]